MNIGQHITVEGAGIAGLCAACELAMRGASVTVIEEKKHAGGDVHVTRDRCFSFDTGPVVLTNPLVIANLFARAGRDAADYYRLFELDPQPRFWFEDGIVLNLNRRPEIFVRMLNQQFPLTRPGGDWLDYVDRLDGDRANSAIRKRDPYVRRLTEYYATISGSGPQSAILDRDKSGMWYPIGGMREVVKSLERLAAELGVQFRYGVAHTDGATAPESDLRGTLRTAVLAESPRQRLIFCFGLKKRFEHLTFLNVFLSSDLAKETESLKVGHAMNVDPTIEVVSPGIIDPSHAPFGGDAMRVMVYTPAPLTNEKWNGPGGLIEKYRVLILDRLKRHGMQDFESRIAAEYVLTPPDFASLCISAGECNDVSVAATAGINAANNIVSKSEALKSVRA